MGLGKKLLLATLLTVFMTVSAVVLAILFIHNERGNYSDDFSVSDSQSGSDRTGGTGNVGGDTLEGLDSPNKSTLFTPERNPWDDDERWQWQGALVKPDGSEHWHYYPVIPADARPGDTVTISAAAGRFVDWEVDVLSAVIEFTDTSTDGESVFVSFIMPEGNVLIRALYEDTSLSIASGGISAASASIITLGDALPDGMVGADYNLTIFAPAPGNPEDTVWEWGPIVPAFGGVPVPGLVFTQISKDEFTITGIPTDAHVDAYKVEIRLRWPNPDYDEDDDDCDEPEFLFGPIQEFSIKIWEHPVIQARDPFLPGMVGATYHYNNVIETNVPVPDGMVWGFVGTPPPGLDLQRDPNDATKGQLFGIPTSPGTPPGTPQPFTVTLVNQSNGFFGTVTPRSFNVTILPRPVFQDRDDFLPGIVGAQYHFESEIFIDGVPDEEWKLDIVGLPTPFDITDADFDFDIVTETYTVSAEIQANPRVLTAGTFPFIVTLTSTDDNLNIGGTIIRSTEATGDDEPYSIFIYPQPIWHPDQEFDLEERMVWPEEQITNLLNPYDPPVPLTEREEGEVFEVIEATGFPKASVTTTWEWTIDVTAPLSFPACLTWTPVEDGTFERLTIDGGPINAGIYDFRFNVTSEDDINENMAGSVLSGQFRLIIWERRYIYITVFDINVNELPIGQVRQVDKNGDAESWGRPDEPNNLFRGRRAIIPGGRAEVSVSPGGTFVRWEIDRTRTLRDFEPVGGPYEEGLGWGFDGSTALFRVDMPRVVTLASVTGKDNDVYYRGYLRDRIPVITAPILSDAPNIPDGEGVTQLTPGVVGDSEFGRLFEFVDPTDVVAPGGTSLGMIWEVRNVNFADPKVNEALPGVFLSFEGRMANIRGEPEMPNPSVIDPFRFTLGITLPGTMRIDRTYSVFIDNPPDVIWGDVNGDGKVDLNDLIMLSRYRSGHIPRHEINEVAANVHRNFDSAGRPIIDNRDLGLLARFFASPGVGLGVPG